MDQFAIDGCVKHFSTLNCLINYDLYQVNLLIVKQNQMSWPIELGLPDQTSSTVNTTLTLTPPFTDLSEYDVHLSIQHT